MFQDMDGDIAIEKALLEIQACLAVAADDVQLWKAIAYFGRHVLTQLDGIVAALLLRRELLVTDVFAKAGSDLDRRLESRTRMPDRKAVVEGLYESKATRKLLEPEFHESVAYLLLLLRHR